MSGAKRKVAELGEHVISAAVGDVVARGMSAAVGRFEARASADEQLERLGTLSMMVHSAVEAAEGVHIRSWWLRRWLWNLRDAALDADELLRLFRRRRAAEEAAAAAAGRQQAAAAAGTGTWNTLWSALRSAKSLLFGGGEDDAAVERLGRMVARLEREAMRLGDFLKVLDLEIRRSLPALEVQSDSGPSSSIMVALQGHASLVHKDDDGAAAGFQDVIIYQEFQHRQPQPSARVDHELSFISHDEYVAGVRNMFLLLLTQRIRRALDRLTRKPPPPPPPPVEDADRLRDTVASIRRAAVSAGAEFHGERCWLALWRGELEALADRADRALMLAAGAGGDDAGDGGLRSTARSVEMAAAQLEAFVTLAGFARRQPPSWRHGGSSGDIKGRRLWMFMYLLIILLVTVCLLVTVITTRRPPIR